MLFLWNHLIYCIFFHMIAVISSSCLFCRELAYILFFLWYNAKCSCSCECWIHSWTFWLLLLVISWLKFLTQQTLIEAWLFEKNNMLTTPPPHPTSVCVNFVLSCKISFVIKKNELYYHGEFEKCLWNINFGVIFWQLFIFNNWWVSSLEHTLLG